MQSFKFRIASRQSIQFVIFFCCCSVFNSIFIPMNSIYYCFVIVIFHCKCFVRWLSFCIWTHCCCWFFHSAKNHLFIYHSNLQPLSSIGFQTHQAHVYSIHIVYIFIKRYGLTSRLQLQPPDEIRSIHRWFFPICLNPNSLK